MVVWITLFCVFYKFQIVTGQINVKQQIFRVQSQDIQAKEGDSVILPCEIENRAGEVQWTMDGMALGYNPVIPGHPRYEVIGDKIKGIFNLKITNVSVDDNAEFQCQVGPKIISEKERFAPNRSIVRLNVITPPSSIQMFDYANNTKVAVLENQELTLKCLVRNSKPPAKVIWYRNKNELKLEQTNKTVCRPRNKTEECDILSTIIVKCSLSDELVNYSCEARHEALPKKMSMFMSIQLTVLYPPGPPHIDGYTEDPSFSLSEGQKLELTCRSSGGNPLAQLVWFKNGIKLQNFISYKMHGKISESNLNINLEPNDNEANYTCESSNGATKVPLKNFVKLSVSFGPKNVELIGPEDAKAGEIIHVECKTSTSYPNAEIQWIVDGQKKFNKTSDFSSGDNGGSITSSWLTLTVPKDRKELLIYCYGNNPRSSKNVVANKTIRIYYPPGHPVISGYIRGGYITSGVTQDLLCTSSGGNPLATLTWFKNDQRISSVKKQSDKISSFAEITISVSETDNGAVYKCEAVNPTISSPYIDTLRLNVYFPPKNATISIEPNILHTNSLAKLHCNTSSSNPPAEITWWKNNAVQVTDGVSSSFIPGEYGGNLTLGELVLNVTADMHKNTLTCRATNAVLQQSVNIPIELSVMYKPLFLESGHSTFFSKVERDSFALSFEVKANPEKIIYRWMKNKEPLKRYVEGATLTIPELNRNDAGFYTCEAENTEGSNRTSFQLDVKYEATIVNITKMVMVSNGSDAEMICTVSGNPIESDDIWWVSLHISDWDRRSNTKFHNNTSIFTLSKATVQDMGYFYCIVNNGIGAETNATTRLIIEHAPKSEITPQIIKIAAHIGELATFNCKGSGAPKLDFIWFKDDTMINKTIKYLIEYEQIDELNFSSTLHIKQVHLSDYGKYNCIIRNKLGHVKIVYELFNHSKPDQPSKLRLINITQNSITLSWNLNFDGGMPTKFKIRYFDSNREDKKYYKIVDSTTLYTVTELLSGVNYVFDIMAFNNLGESNYSTMAVNATTNMSTGKEPIDLPVEGEGLILLVAAGVGILLLLLNVLIILACVCNRNKKSKKGLAESCNKSIEMYAPPSRSSNDVSSGTISSLQTEKSINFSASDDNRNHINDDRNELHMSYIIEDINYPFTENNGLEFINRNHCKEKFHEFPYEGYSTISHPHHLQRTVSSHDCDFNSSLNFIHTTLPGRRRTTHLSDLCYQRESSPTPSIPPPMSTISTNAYRSIQSNNFLRL